MMDDGRADALGCYGRPWAKTPHMDAIAARGVLFRTATVQNPVCVPSRTSMKTGLYAHETGRIAMGKPSATPGAYRTRIRKDQADLLLEWEKLGVTPENVGKVHAFAKDWRRLGDVPAQISHQGKPTRHLDPKWHDRLLSCVLTETHRWMIGGVLDVPPKEMRTSKLGNLAVKRLEELVAKDAPFFLRVSFHAPHVACNVPKTHFIDPSTITLPLPTDKELAAKPRYEREHLRVYAGAPKLTREEIGIARGTYYGMIALVDDQVGRLVKVLQGSGRLADTIVVINSDQGFQLGEHGVWKKRDFYDTNVCVPFILSAPDLLPQGKVVEEPVEMIDFMPTLMDLCGLKPPADISGRSLMPLIRGEEKNWRRACFSEHDHSRDMYAELRSGGGRRVMVRTKEWKLVFFMDERVPDKDGALYHLAEDPWERWNLYHDPKHREIVSELEALAKAWDKGRR
jgi:arylsulfatase A-like enzyme